MRLPSHDRDEYLRLGRWRWTRWPVAILAAGLALNPAVAAPIDGIWIEDLASVKLPPLVDRYAIEGGRYRCDSCVPRRDYPADGKPHAIVGDPDVTIESMTVAGPRTIVTRIIGPGRTRETTMTVARDGRTANYVSIDRRTGVTDALRTGYLAKRTSAARPGTHSASGEWTGIRYTEVPEQLRTIELHETDGRLRYSVPTGYRYDAPIDGGHVPVTGPYKGGVEVSAQRLSENAFRETRWRDGAIIVERTYTIAADGRTMKIVTHEPASGRTYEITSTRQ